MNRTADERLTCLRQDLDWLEHHIADESRAMTALRSDFAGVIKKVRIACDLLPDSYETRVALDDILLIHGDKAP